MTVFDNIQPPTVLYKTHSDLNGEIEVVQSKSTVKLMIDGAMHSANYDSPIVSSMFWGRAVDLLKKESPNVENILILGLGGGTMQHLLSRAFPETSITSVEIDPVIVDIAKSHFDLDSIANHTVIVDDACRVIVEPQKSNLDLHTFDVVIVDIFCGHKFPDLGNSGNFFARIKDLLVPNGLVVFHRLYTQDFQLDVDDFVENVENFFNTVATVAVPGRNNAENLIIYGRS